MANYLKNATIHNIHYSLDLKIEGKAVTLI